MRTLVTIYTLAVLLPSILLAALALRTQGGQELVIRQQRALVHQATVDALAAEAADFIETEYSSFVSFAETVPKDWPTPAVHFTVSTTGDLITPPEDLGENRDFLRGDATASIYKNFVLPDKLERLEEADQAFESYRSSKVQSQSGQQRNRTLFKSKKESVADANAAEDSFIDQESVAPSGAPSEIEQ